MADGGASSDGTTASTLRAVRRARPDPADADDPVKGSGVAWATPAYFDALRLRVREGGGIFSRVQTAPAGVGVMNDTVARDPTRSSTARAVRGTHRCAGQ